jgi:hypothetical protein
MFEVSITWKVGTFPVKSYVNTEEEAWSAVNEALANGAYKAEFRRV